jgi:predicted PurR-regulated permease PerM
VAVSRRNQLVFWGVGLAVAVLFLWLLAGTMLPFLLGAAIAYFLDPVADRLQALGLNRLAATAIISIAGLVVFVLVLLLAVPALVTQAQAFVEAAPGYLEAAQNFLAARFPEFFAEGARLRRTLAAAQTALQEGGMAALNAVLVSSFVLLDFVLLLVLTPVISFYLLLDWDRFVATIDGWLPREHALTVRRLAREMDEKLAGFVRGQLTVCLILGAFYAAALMAIGLSFGFLVGMIAGLISFIPFVGSMVGGALSIGIALFQFWEQPFWILVTAAIFGFGQFVEGNILAPNLIGKSVGLHPVWLILALSVFGALFGFAGLLIAVPVTAALGVLGRFAVEQYLASPLYTGRLPPPET